MILLPSHTGELVRLLTACALIVRTVPFQVQPTRQAKAGGQACEFRSSGASQQELQVTIQISYFGYLLLKVLSRLCCCGSGRSVMHCWMWTGLLLRVH